MDILNQLKVERDRLDAAISALTGTKTRGRPAGSGSAHRTKRVKRKMSAAARAKIGAAARARWAKAKKAGKNHI